MRAAAMILGAFEDCTRFSDITRGFEQGESSPLTTDLFS